VAGEHLNAEQEFSMNNESLQQALALLDELKQQASDGSLIPVRIPGQIQAIRDLLAQVPAEQVPAGQPPTLPAQAAVPAAEAGDEDPLATLQREQSEFLSTAVHEFRIPLTSIRGYSDMLAKNVLGELNEQQAQFMDIIRTNVLRLDHLISDVSDVGKLRGKRLHIEPRMDMAKNILLMAQKDLEPLAAERQIALVFEVPDGLPLLNVDGKRVAQALGNLIRNALQYSPEGSTVTVTAGAEAGGLRVMVTDSGVGMTPDEMTHLGEPFWRSDNEVVRSVKGHGLGYAVAKGIVELMGGTMHADSTFGKGSTFGFTLPGMS
jgi:signal transduction histidine kinase